VSWALARGPENPKQGGVGVDCFLFSSLGFSGLLYGFSPVFFGFFAVFRAQINPREEKPREGPYPKGRITNTPKGKHKPGALSQLLLLLLLLLLLIVLAKIAMRC
jgi:hypothetical protein